jgi:cytidylate kinase
MAVITISRQFGTGEVEFTNKLVDALGYPLFDEELIQQVAEELEVHTGVVRALDERLEPSAIQGALARIAGGRWRRQLPTQRTEGGVRPEIVRTAVRSVVWEIGRRSDAIIVGRGAGVILGDLRGVLKLRLVAPLDDRVRRRVRDLGENVDDVEAEIRRVDGERRQYIRRMFNVDWEDPSLYDLVINTGRTDVDTAVKLSTTLLKEKQL